MPETSGRFDGAGPNPNYTEAYGQLDLSVGYAVNDQFSIGANVFYAWDWLGSGANAPSSSPPGR